MTFTQGEPKGYHSSLGVTRTFCEACGTPLSYESNRWANEIHILVGTLDWPDAVVPTAHAYCIDQLPWIGLADGLPRYATTPSEGPPLA